MQPSQPHRPSVRPFWLTFTDDALEHRFRRRFLSENMRIAFNYSMFANILHAVLFAKTFHTPVGDSVEMKYFLAYLTLRTASILPVTFASRSKHQRYTLWLKVCLWNRLARCLCVLGAFATRKLMGTCLTVRNVVVDVFISATSTPLAFPTVFSQFVWLQSTVTLVAGWTMLGNHGLCELLVHQQFPDAHVCQLLNVFFAQVSDVLSRAVTLEYGPALAPLTPLEANLSVTAWWLMVVGFLLPGVLLFVLESRSRRAFLQELGDPLADAPALELGHRWQRDLAPAGMVLSACVWFMMLKLYTDKLVVLHIGNGRDA